jgi:hypothetical protein
MGLLDDAIREHLELKRRHGASDEEIEQEEAEALGPARRDFPAQAAAEAAAEQGETEDSLEDGAPPGVEPSLPDEAPVPLGRETLAETVIDEPPPPEPEPEDEPEEAFEPEPEPEDPRQETDEDVLEETPEFLQDAPEHDRLWFEQKPPRDFDFE